MSEPTRDEDRTETSAQPKPLATLTPLAGLQTLDLGLDSAMGMVCDIDDPDCVPGVLPGTGASTAAMTGDDEA